MGFINKKNFQLTGFGLALGWSYVMVAIFFTAFFNPSQSVIVYVNRAGEAMLESIVIPIVLVFCTVAFVWFVIDLYRGD